MDGAGADPDSGGAPGDDGGGRSPAASLSDKLLKPSRSFTESFTNLRRRKLTQVEVLSAAPPLSSLHLPHVLGAVAASCIYTCACLPRIMAFGRGRWEADVAAGVLEARPGGPYADVRLSYVIFTSFAYIGLVFLAVSRMAQRSPTGAFIFEAMAVHNVTQCLYNLYCFVALLAESYTLGLRAWGNAWETSPQYHALGSLIWLQYHCRQLQLLETFFMIWRKKFQGLSFLHLYLRVLNLWGWFIACHFVCGGETFFPALVCSACQGLVYGLYFCYSLQSPGNAAVPPALAVHIFELQILQYVVCAVHSVAASIWGNFPLGLALLHLFSISNGLILYTDFHSKGPSTGKAADSPRQSKPGFSRRVTFSFDSCGWLMVYHFGVGCWISEHMGLEIPSAEQGSDDGDSPDRCGAAPAGVGFSGSSGGGLIAVVLGAGTRVRDVFDYIVTCYPECRKNPLRMFAAVDKALKHFQYKGAHRRLSGHIRILLTRVTWRPPFVMGEVRESFPDNETAIKIFAASCHIPVLDGVLPHRIGDRFYYDGLMWPARMLVPWRGADGDYVVRVSATGTPSADITLRQGPMWWGVFPPPPHILRGIFWCGYRDAASWFLDKPAPAKSMCRYRRPRDENGNGDAAAPATSGTVLGGEEDAEARWHAAQALLQHKPSRRLPKVDPVTGEDIDTLIEQAETMAHSAKKAMSRVLTCVLVGAVALGLVVLAPPTTT